MGVMRVLNRSGDSEMHWDPNLKHSVAQAQTEFDELIKCDLKAWKADEHGVGTEKLNAFDPSAHEIVFTRRLVGG